MKQNRKELAQKARRIQQLIDELRDDVIKAEKPEVSDAYRAYIMGTEPEMMDRFSEFSSRIAQ